MENPTINVVMLGASGAVGTQVLQMLEQKSAKLSKLTLLGRTPIANSTATFVQQHKIDVFNPNSYKDYLGGHQVAICTFGVGQPSKVSKEEFIKVDKDAVLDFAKACKIAGIKHFELLASVGLDANSSSLYLKTKGELVEALKALGFERLSVFEPSVIITPSNRYGFAQGVLLMLTPLLKPFLLGGARKYRGIPVEILGKAMALNIFQTQVGYERLWWDDFYRIVK